MDIMNYKHDIPLFNIIPENLQSAILNENENEKQQDSWQIATNMLTASQPKDKQSNTTNWPDEYSETIVQFNLNEASIPNDQILEIAKLLSEFKDGWAEEVKA